MAADKRASRPAAVVTGGLFPGIPLDVIDAYAGALLALSERLSLPRLGGEERRALRAGAEPVGDANDCAGALRFAPQVVRRTGVTPEHIEEALAMREALAQLRDLALRLALGAADGLDDEDGRGAEDGKVRAIFARARRGEEVAAGPVSEAIAAEREALERT